MRILFVTSTRIGDAVLSTGLLAHLVATHPEARFTIACGKDAAPLFEAVPRLDRIHVIVKRPRGAHWLALWRAAVATHWDLVVDIRRSALAWMLRARSRRVFPGDDGPAHRVVALASTLDLSPAPSPVLWLADRHREAAARLIPPGPPVLALGPGANWIPKRWPADRFARLAERLLGADAPLAGGRLAVFGGPAERADMAPVLDAVPPARLIDCVGTLDLLTVSAALRRAALFVGNDSGLMHIAAASGVPTLGLFGPSRTEWYAPWGEHAAAVRTPQSFAELGGDRGFAGAGDRSLMDGLALETVERAALDLWRRRRDRAA